ncbi:MAG: hypothetical protein R3199_07925 [Gemmatimonadota bacterium]|nr:hypothetical protein [Gemmatimonadota bacterium]
MPTLVRTAAKILHLHVQRLLVPRKSLPEERVMMFHPPRAGSTVLAKMLHQHPEVRWEREAFLEVSRQLGMRRLPATLETVLLTRMAGVREPIVGFEVQYYQIPAHLMIRLPAFVRRVRNLGFRRFIVLSRRNILRSVVSNLVAHERQQWAFDVGDRVELTRVHVDVERVYDHRNTALLDVLARHEENPRRVRELLPQYLELVYEDDVEEDPHVGYRRICEYLGLEPVEVTIPIQRATPYPMPEVVENWDEVCETLAGTRFEWMLEE